MDERKNFEQSLSNGQKQRLIIAKLLYWLDDTIDVLVLDECTSGLDEKSSSSKVANAESILAYIVQYANMDKNHIIIIATHQDIDGFKTMIEPSLKIKTFEFVNEGEENIIREIK